ncbi:hypothetical protein [uncultured Alistipes sp.]|uniref:hypothetical protein n=1 Tax=uncultured Alistipes sp. TaxID=538949 RepID=UPI0025E6C296|nr:hypothetical protein [uncultured Alistipes sp.]
MKRLFAITFAASRLVACVGKGVPFPSGNPGRAKATLDSIYKRCGVGGSCLLRENHPFDAECQAGYVLSGDRACPNACSCLWPFSGILSAVTAMPGADASYRSVLEGRVLPRLAEYLDTTRMPAACAAYVEAAPERFCDAGRNGRNVRPHGHPETQTKPITKTT